MVLTSLCKTSPVEQRDKSREKLPRSSFDEYDKNSADGRSFQLNWVFWRLRRFVKALIKWVFTVGPVEAEESRCDDEMWPN